VLDDTEERSGFARTKEVHVDGPYLARRHVVHALEAQHVTLEGDETKAAPGALAVDAPCDVKQIEMGRLGRRRRPRHHEARAKQGHVEALAVERHEHRCRLDAFAQALEHRRFLAERPHEQLFEDQRGLAAAVPKRQPDEERDGARAPGEPRRLRVQKERPSRVARGQQRVEGQKREQLGARVASVRDGGTAGPVRQAKAVRAYMERAPGGLYRGEREIDGLDARKRHGRSPGTPLDRGADAGPQAVDEAGSGSLRGGQASRFRRGGCEA